MTLTELHPFVLPSVIGCPTPTVNHHLLQSAIAFCRKTLCYTETLDSVVADGVSNNFDLDTPRGFNSIRVLSFGINGIDKSKTLVDPRRGLQLSRSSNAGEFAFTPNSSTISIYPTCAKDDLIDVDVALEPSINLVSLPDDVFREYANDIATGALSTLMRMPKTAWENQNLSMANMSMFNGRCATIAMKVSRGRSASKMRNHKSYF